uniref:Uncharacterized protein n=1 Tax=Lepeophtheirus salmonis TaxID=72036 RepID=A0A0K2TBM1_LEPSM
MNSVLTFETFLLEFMGLSKAVWLSSISTLIWLVLNLYFLLFLEERVLLDIFISSVFNDTFLDESVSIKLCSHSLIYLLN